MSVFEFDFLSLFSISNILAILLGTFVGLIIGALPGLGAMIAIVLLLPLTYSMSPLASVLLLMAAYQSAEYGGSISSITLGIPGTAAAVVTTFDGYTLAKKQSPGKALAYSLFASTIGGLFGGLVLIFLTVPLAKFALQISNPEYFLIGILGLIAVAGLSSKDLTKSLISVVLGLLAGTVGMDMFTGDKRFIFNQVELTDGFNLIALVVGMFAISEIFNMIETIYKRYKVDREGMSTRIKISEIKKVTKPIGIGSVLGSIIGVFPGLGAATSSWFSYSVARSFSKKPESFGTGNPEGIAAPESSNNAAVGGALVPLLSLGIPGSPAIAVIMGAFIIHGIQPGPKAFTSNPELLYSIFYGFLLTTLAMYLLGRLLTPAFARVLTVPTYILIPIILTLSIVGVYASKSLKFDLWVALIIGIVFYIFRKLDFSMASFVLALVLSPIIEESLRRALLLSKGSYLVFVTRPYSIILIAIILLLIGYSIIKFLKERNKHKAKSA